MFKNNFFLIYVLKFSIAFCIFYFGTVAIIGLSSPEGYYSPFTDHYLNYVNWLRSSLLLSSKQLLLLFNYSTHISDRYNLVLDNGVGIRMVYSCLGYGIMSFWGAFIIANKGTLKRKIFWICLGWLAIWSINVMRVSLLLIAVNKSWQSPFGIDHHTWFNIAAYSLILLLIYLYHKSSMRIIKINTSSR